MLNELRKKFDKIKLKHFMEPFSTGKGKRNGRTIAVIFSGDKRYIGISECGKKDCYSRKQGREIALGRALRAFKDQSNNGSYGVFDINNIPQNIVDNVPEHLYTIKNKGELK